MTAANPYEAQAREMKVRSLINALNAAFVVTIGRAVSAETMLEATTSYNEVQWLALDRLAQVKRPASEETRKEVIAELRKRVEESGRVRREVTQYERDVDDEERGLAARKGWEIE